MMHPPSLTSKVLDVVVLDDTDPRGLSDQISELEAAGEYHFYPPVQVIDITPQGRCCLCYYATMVKVQR